MQLNINSDSILRFLFLPFFFLLSVFTVQANTAIGEWRTHVPYQNAYFLTQDDEYIYCATNTFFFSYGKEDRAVKRFSKIDGLSDTDVEFVKYNSEKDQLLVIYENGNIDIIQNGRYTNVSDIQRANILGDKRIYGVQLRNGLAYLSTGFGIVVLDMENFEIRDTYYIGEEGDPLRVYNVAFWNDTIWAATEQGLRKASLQSPILANFQFWEWETHANGLLPGSIKDISVFSDTLVIASGDYLQKHTDDGWELLFYEENWTTGKLSVSQGELLVPQMYIDEEEVVDARVLSFSTTVDYSVHTDSRIVRPQHAIKSPDGVLWVADQFRGLIRKEGGQSNNPIVPNSPASNNVFNLTAAHERVYVAPGGADIGWNYTFNQAGFFEYTGNWWNSYNRYSTDGLDTIINIINVSVNPQDKDEIYLGSYYTGLARFRNNEITLYDQYNSILQGAIGDNIRTLITGQAWDNQNNLWLSNMRSADPIVVKTASGDWYNFRPPQNVNSITDLIIDNRGYKWFVVSRSNTHGLLAFTEGQSLENPNPQYRLLSTSLGNGNLPSTDVLSIAEDKDGRIWVGTAEGIAVLFCAGQIFSEQGCDAQRITVVVDGFAGYLFETERVNAIAVDGANRKWVGTNNGVFLISPDGTEQIHHFTIQNSPLLSNIITSITIEGKSGEVFFGTNKGIVSYKSDATKGGTEHSNVLVYPNPVRPEYSGPIAIKGLVDEADVRITDVNGMIVYQTRALGGQAIWDGRGLNGNRARAGVYLVFSANDDGSERNVAKIFLVN